MDRLFLDANVLFSAAYREQAGLRKLWALADASLITSRYALEEARRNLQDDAQLLRLASLVEGLELVDEPDARVLDEEARLPEKDRPTLRAAVYARATHLVTGDVTHFGPFFGASLQGVLVVSPGDFLRSRRRPSP